RLTSTRATDFERERQKSSPLIPRLAKASTQLDRHPITRSINQTDAIGLIIALATEYCARCNDVPHSSPLYRQPFRKFCLRGTRLSILPRSDVPPISRHRFCVTPGPNPKPIWKIPQIGAASSGRAIGIPDPLWIRTTNATPISPLRRRVPRLPVNEPAPESTTTPPFA
ncbi:hypothetical protein K0M31_000238, partial [Melipona bicolor]